MVGQTVFILTEVVNFGKQSPFGVNSDGFCRLLFSFLFKTLSDSLLCEISLTQVAP